MSVAIFAALLATACAGVIFLHAQQLVASGSPAAQASPAPASTAQVAPEGAAVNGPDQQVGQLYLLATDLKSEVAKTDQNMLSIGVVRKASAIEQLAHKLRTGGGGR